MRPSPVFCKALFSGKIAVLVVAGDGKAQMRQMHADLVGAAGLQFHLDQAEILPARHQAHDGMCELALGIDADPTFAFRRQVFVQRQAYMLQFIAPAALDQAR
jgi:hypothetical protein